MISLFISSTFNDMQIERDVLHQKVIPYIRRYASSLGESIRIIDLRWGVDTSEIESEKITEKVIRTCLKGIEQCDNYVIAFLGNRYGWIPLDFPYDYLKSEYGIVFETPVSMTEIELQYGILSKDDITKSLVYMRDSRIESSEKELYNVCDDSYKMESLKKRIKEKGCKIRHYSLMGGRDGCCESDELAQMLIADIVKLLNKKISNTQSGIYYEQENLFKSIEKEKSYGYLQLPRLREAVHEFEHSGDSFFLLQAESGMGKTAFVASLYNLLKNVKIIRFFCGSDRNSIYPENILDYLLFSVCEHMGLDYTNMEIGNNKRQLLTSLLYTTKKEIRIVIDAVDQLKVPFIEQLNWMPISLPHNVRIYITTNHKMTYQMLHTVWPTRLVNIDRIHNQVELVRHMFSYENKELSEGTLKKIIEEKDFTNYLYAKMFVRAFVLMDRFDFERINNNGGNIRAINTYLFAKSKELPDDIHGLGLCLIQELGAKLNPKFAEKILSLLAISEIGIRPLDIESLFPSIWNEYEFINFVDFLNGFISFRGDGCIDFTHSILKETVHVYDDSKIRILYYRHILSLENSDPIKIKIGLKICAKLDEVETAIVLISDNRDSDYCVNQCIELIREEFVFIRKLVSDEEILSWVIEKVVPKAKENNFEKLLVTLFERIIHNYSEERQFELHVLLGDLYYANRDDYNAHSHYSLALNCDEIIKKITHEEYISLQMKWCKSASAKQGKDVELLKECLLHIRRSMEKRYLKTFSEKILYWECRYLLFIVNLSSITFFKRLNLPSQTLKKEGGTSYISFKSHFADQQLDKNEQEEVFRILKTIIADYTKSESQHERIEYLEVIMQYVKYLSSIKNKEGLIKDLLDVKTILTEDLKEYYSIQLYLYLAKLNYYISKFLSNSEKKQYLEESCEIWERFVFDSGKIPPFVDIYISAVQDLQNIYLEENDWDKYIDMITKECNISYELLSTNVEYALGVCREYPDENRLFRLEMERESLNETYRTFLQKKYLRHSRQLLIDLSSRISLFHQIEYFRNVLPCKFTVSMLEPTVIEQILEVYSRISSELKDENRDQIEYVQFRLLVTVYYALKIYESKLDENSEAELLKPNIFYENKIGLLHLLIALSDGEITRIQLKYELACSLYEKAIYDEDGMLECYQEADNILLQLKSEVGESEVINATLYNEEITLYKINILHCKVLYEIAAFNFEKCKYNKAYDFLSITIANSLASYGMVDNAIETDQLLLFIAKMSCEMALDCEEFLDKKGSSYIEEMRKIINSIYHI